MTDADLILHVVDSSDADPRSQISAVREVLAEIGAREVPELIVFNKSDAADPILLKGLQLVEPHSIVVSARTGDGLTELMAEIERLVPRPSIEVCVLLPYARGDLLARAHRGGRRSSPRSSTPTDAGTALRPRGSGPRWRANWTASSSPRGRLKVR